MPAAPPLTRRPGRRRRVQQPHGCALPQVEALQLPVLAGSGEQPVRGAHA